MPMAGEMNFGRGDSGEPETIAIAIDLLRRDLAGFADPGAPIEIKERPDGWVRAKWEMKENRREADFLLSGSPSLRDARVRFDNDETSYPSFLASPIMADLRGLARNLLGRIKHSPSYVPPHAYLESGLASVAPESTPADKLLLEAAIPDSELTQLIFLTAPAGVGKTSLLKEAVCTIAERYRTGAANALWLYVDAQGRRLAKLDDAISGDLGKARASFSFDATATLVRVGALVLVVDGFDELLGIAGSYDESFSSLASFLDELNASGCVVAAARSAYYEQEFVSRVNKAIGFRTEGWILTRLRLEEWSEPEVDLFVRNRSAERGFPEAEIGAMQTAVKSAFSGEAVRHLSGIPFFVSRVTDLATGGHDLAGGASLLEQLVNSYLKRESEEKLRERPGRSYLTTDQLRELFSEIAEEMWRQDTRELSTTSLREVLSVWLEVEGLDPETQLAVVDRGPYAALLQSSEQGGVRFEHDVYYAYFLAGPIVDLARRQDALRLRQALRRGRLPAEAAELAGARLHDDKLRDAIEVVLSTCERQDLSTAQVRQNAGTVIAGILKSGPAIENLALRNLNFSDCSLSKVILRSPDLTRCSFVGVDLRGFQIISGSGKHLEFERVLIDSNSTKLELPLEAIETFRAPQDFTQDRAVRSIYEPGKVLDLLASCGVAMSEKEVRLRPVDQELMESLNLAVAVFSKTNLFTELDESSEVRRLVASGGWTKARNAMIDVGILTRSRRQASGNKTFLRVHCSPNDLLAGQDLDAVVPSNIRDLWDLLQEKSTI